MLSHFLQSAILALKAELNELHVKNVIEEATENCLSSVHECQTLHQNADIVIGPEKAENDLFDAYDEIQRRISEVIACLLQMNRLFQSFYSLTCM